MMNPLHISMEEVSVLFGDRPVLDKLNLQISPGKTTVIIGASGSGKSILLKVMAGLVPPTHGSVKRDGKSLFLLSEKEEIEFRRRTGLCVSRWGPMG
ncbi:MAG: ATP-binding cassette domain-containing protein [Spirochaetia bacterium]|nr:ATP-binding cassette domain-containing protein [Spirochaetia bacterium]